MSKYWVNSPAQGEKGKLNISMVPITVVGAKYDQFAQSFEPAAKKTLCQALRYICYRNGCDLVFTSIMEERPMRNFREMMKHHLFRDFPQFSQDEKEPKPESDGPIVTGNDFQMYPAPERDPMKALNIYASTDTERHIGEPPNANMRHNKAIEILWQEQVETQFKKS
mmetsp:Transcript_37763/g.57818  ORF Transcript_37763/g.57818 Transcript_37763/m.57818 type:complete len:167 (+) Transcript_37763:624-1124(+)